MARIQWTRLALEQLDELLASIAEEDPDTAVSVANTIDKSISRLETFPESAPVYRAFLRRFSIPGLSVSCYYRYAAGIVRILRIRRDQRNPL